MSQGRLANRRILITGAASGIGRATAELFAGEGARCALLDRDAAQLKEVKCPDAFRAAVDITDEAGVEQAVRNAAEHFGALDGLINAAGIAGAQLLADTDVTSWQKILDVNLTGAMRVTRAALKYLRQSPTATIVNVASGIGLRPLPGQGAYAASKAGLLAWSKVLAQELAPSIRVNATCPGATDTPLMRANMPVGFDAKTLNANYLLQRQGEALEQAQAILFLTGPESTFITGVSLAVDGGRTFH